MSRARFALASATALAGLAVLTACGSGSTGSSSTPAAPSAPAPAGLSVQNVGSVGQVITAADGKTLYTFDMDTTNPPVSHCDGACATTWPPVVAGPATANAQGIDKSLLGTVKRKDGSEQLTIAGKPVYEFANDKAPGQANGQGVKNVWFAITASGTKAGQAPVAPPASSSSSSNGGGGYGGY